MLIRCVFLDNQGVNTSLARNSDIKNDHTTKSPYASSPHLMHFITEVRPHTADHAFTPLRCSLTQNAPFSWKQEREQENDTPSKTLFWKQESPLQRRTQANHYLKEIVNTTPLAIQFDDEDIGIRKSSWNPGRRSSFMSRAKQESSVSRTSVGRLPKALLSANDSKEEY